MRLFLVIGGFCAMYLAALILLVKPLPHNPLFLPFAPLSPNVPYFIYIRAWQGIFGTHPEILMFANSLIVLASAGLAFRVGRIAAGTRHGLAGATMSAFLFLANPLAMMLPLTLGFLGGMLLVPFLILLFLNVLLAVENWSTLMRGFALAAAWSLFLWVHFPTALMILAVMILWVFYNRRPLAALSVFLTVAFGGTTLFAILWVIGCAVARRWSILPEPVDTLRTLWTYVHQGLTSAGSGSFAIIDNRLVNVAGWLSPFFLILGLWASGEALLRMHQERRAKSFDLPAIAGIFLFGVVVFTPGKDFLPGAWYLLALAALWSPLVSLQLAQTENLYSRGFRWTFLAGLISCAVCLLWNVRGTPPTFMPNGFTLLQLAIVVALGGGISYWALKKHPLSVTSRLRALLSGAAVAYFVVVNGGLMWTR